MKKCPYCAEQIQDEAIVCRYCGRELSPMPTIAQQTKSEKKLKRLSTAVVLNMFPLIMGLGYIYLGKLGRFIIVFGLQVFSLGITTAMGISRYNTHLLFVLWFVSLIDVYFQAVAYNKQLHASWFRLVVRGCPIAKRTVPVPAAVVKPALLVSQDEAKAKILAQLEKGREIESLPIRNDGDLKDAQTKYEGWKLYTRDLLLNIFGTEAILRDFIRPPASVLLLVDTPFNWQVEQHHSKVGESINRLESIYERIDLYEFIPPGITRAADPPEGDPRSIQNINFYGSVNTGGGDIVGGDKNITFDHQLLAEIFRQIDLSAHTPQDKEDLKGEVNEIIQEAQKDDKADESFLSRRLRNLKRMAPDIFDVVVSCMAGPLPAVGMVLKKISEKAREEANKTAA